MVLYIGVTNDLQSRTYEHENSLIPGFSKKYNCNFLVYYEHFLEIKKAIEREKKDKIIFEFNPEWKFLNEEICESL